MASKAGILTIDLEANISKLVKGMNTAEKRTEKAFKNMKRVVGAFGLYLTGGAIINAFKQTSAEVDKLAKTSQKLGIGVVELQKLQFAGEQTGVAINTTNMALQRMTRRVSEASRGTGEAKDALKELNLQAVALAQLSPEKQFSAIADAMSNVTNEGDRVRLSMKLFDSEGVALINTLSLGSAGLKAYGDELSRIGVLSEAETKAIENFNDSMNKTNKVVGYIQGKLTALASTGMKKITDALNNWAVNGGAEKLWKDLLIIGEVGYRTGKVFSTLALTIEKSYNNVQLTILKTGLEIETFLGTMNKSRESLTKFKIAMKEFRNTQLEGDIAKNMKVLKSEIGSIIDEYNVFNLVVGKSNNTVKTGQVEQLTMWDNLKKAMKVYTDGVATEFEQMQTLVNGVTATMVNGIMGGFRSMMDGASDWGEAFKGIIKDIIAQLIKVLIIQRLIDGIVGAVPTGSVSGGSVSGGSVSGTRASGGGVSGGSSYVVGEHGREIFTPSTSGTISNGGDMVVNINNYSDTSVTTKQTDSGIEVFIRQIEPMIADGIRRGTSPIVPAIRGM